MHPRLQVPRLLMAVAGIEYKVLYSCTTSHDAVALLCHDSASAFVLSFKLTLLLPCRCVDTVVQAVDSHASNPHVPVNRRSQHTHTTTHTHRWCVWALTVTLRQRSSHTRRLGRLRFSRTALSKLDNLAPSAGENTMHCRSQRAPTEAPCARC